jgi:hypothetical protein
MTVKSFKVQAPGPNVIRFSTAAIYDCLLKARVLVLGKPFQPRLMFVGVARMGAYPKVEHLKGASLG